MLAMCFFELRFLSSKRPVTSTPILIAMDSDLFVNGGLASRMVGQRNTFADVCCICFCKDRPTAVFVCLTGCCAVGCCALIGITKPWLSKPHHWAHHDCLVWQQIVQQKSQI